MNGERTEPCLTPKLILKTEDHTLFHFTQPKICNIDNSFSAIYYDNLYSPSSGNKQTTYKQINKKTQN